MTTLHALKQHATDLLNDEQGTLFRHGRVRVAMVYPSPYRAGMSSLGYQVLYRAINERPACQA